MRRARPSWRAFLAVALLAMLTAEVAGILVLYRLALGGAVWTYPLDLAVLGSIGVATGIAVRAIPDSRRGNRAAGGLVALIFGTTHWSIGLFGVLSIASERWTRVPPPTYLVFADPELIASLLFSVGVSLTQLIGWILIALVAHVALYLAAAPAIVAALRRVYAARLRLPGATPVRLGLAFIAGTILLDAFLPGSLIRHEPVHLALRKDLFDGFVMAPSDLQITFGKPDRSALPGGRLPHPRPVVLIIVDALRPDRMGVYNSRLDTTPFLSGLMRSGALHRVDRAYGSCSFSFCGIIGILAGRTWDDFGSMPVTMIDVLNRYRYRSYLILSGNHGEFGNLRPLYGPVTEFSDQALSGTERRNNDLDMLGRLQATRFPDPATSFLYLHLMSAHSGSYLLPEYRPAGPESDPRSTANLMVGPDSPLRYDWGVRQADEIIRRIFAILDAKGLLRDAIVVITADHGERLGEDGRYMHGGDPDERILSVPLLIYDRATGYPIRSLASHIDIAPTLLRAVGAPIPPGMPGVPLQDMTTRWAIPFGTYGKVGAVERLGDVSYQYICKRETGEAAVRKLEQPQTDGVPIARTAATRALYDRLQSGFHAIPRARPVKLGPC